MRQTALFFSRADFSESSAELECFAYFCIRYGKQGNSETDD